MIPQHILCLRHALAFALALTRARSRHTDDMFWDKAGEKAAAADEGGAPSSRPVRVGNDKFNFDRIGFEFQSNFRFTI